MGKGRQAALTKERVIGVAVRLADERGIAALSMRKLAAELGVEAMSLYHHLANKDEILDALVDVVFTEIDLPEGPDWQQAMRRRAESTRAVMTRHRWALGLMDSRTTPGSATLRHHESVLRCLRTAGFPVDVAAHAYALLDSYVYGFVLQELSLPFQTSDEANQVAGDIFQGQADELPYLTELANERVSRPGYTFGAEFLPGLDFILAGLEGLRSRQQHR